MGNKRPHQDTESSGPVENEARKRLRTNRPHRAKPAVVDLDSLNAIKKRARAIERLLARENLKLPANKQNDLERELAAHKRRIEDARMKKDRSHMIHKYHMVRFFERKKAIRFAKQLEKKVAQATDPEEAAQLKADLHVAQVDIDYAIYFPFMEPYISLYAAAAAGENEGETSKAAVYLRTPRPPMWTVVEKTREEGQAALERLQNRRPQADSGSGAAQQPAQDDVTAKEKPAKKGRKGGQQTGAKASSLGPKQKKGQSGRTKDDDEGSDDGGFFEED